MREPPPVRPRAVLLDWDNTLVETWPVIHDAMNATLAAMGRRGWSYAETQRRVRRSMRESFPELFGARWERAREVFYARFREIHLSRLKARPGAAEMLAELARRGLYLGVVSNKSGQHLRREAAHLGWDGYFGRLVGASDAAHDKPSRDPVEMALHGSGIAAGEEVWMVGDTEIDLECAHNAGCVPVLLRESAPRPGEFGKFVPKLHFRGCAELTALVSRLEDAISYR